MMSQPQTISREPIYADYAATTPCDPRVIDHMAEIMGAGWGNPSNLHNAYGRRSRKHLDQSRQALAALLHVSETELTFTSGATEACNMAIKSLAVANPDKQLIVSPTEHPAIVESARIVERAGIAVHWLKVDHNGLIDWDDLSTALKKPSSAIAAMLVNNQTGLLMPHPPLREFCQRSGAVWISDITQAIPRMEVNLPELGIDIAMCSAHKIYGPQGCGALYVRRGLHLAALINGGGQEANLRSGTENVAGIAGFGRAVELQLSEGLTRIHRLRHLTDLLEGKLSERIPSRVFFSEEAQRVPGITYLAIPDAAPQLIRRIPQVIISPGSSCASLKARPSEALLAMGINERMAANALRISLSHVQTDEDIMLVAEAICQGISS